MEAWAALQLELLMARYWMAEVPIGPGLHVMQVTIQRTDGQRTDDGTDGQSILFAINECEINSCRSCRWCR